MTCCLINLRGSLEAYQSKVKNESESCSVVSNSLRPHGQFPRQEYWNGLPFPSSGDLSDPGTEPRSPTLEADSLPSEPARKPQNNWFIHSFVHSFTQKVFIKSLNIYSYILELYWPIYPIMDQKYFKKHIPQSQKTNLNILLWELLYSAYIVVTTVYITHNCLCIIYIVLRIISNLEIKYMGRHVEVFLPFYIKDFSIFRFWYLSGFWSQFPRDTEGRLSCKTK